MDVTVVGTEAVIGRPQARAVMEGVPRGEERGRALPVAVRWAAIGTGLLGIGLGVAELLIPGRFNRLVGVRDSRRSRWLTRAFGLRELATSVPVLARRRPAPWLWARTAGDLLDLALLASAFRFRGARLARLAGAMGAVFGATAGDLFGAVRSTGRSRALLAAPARGAITVAATPEAVYRFWRDLGNLPRFMERLESVDVLSPERSRWYARVPGSVVAWDAEIVEDRPGELIRWRSAEGGDLSNRGAVQFRAAPGGRGTEIVVELEYVPPAGELGRLASWFSTAAVKVQLERDLRRLKQLLELGEIVQPDTRADRERQSQNGGRP